MTAMYDFEAQGFSGSTSYSPGVYVLIHKPTGAVYVGSSGKTKARIGQHLSDLRTNRHQSKNLQDIVQDVTEIAYLAKETPTVEEALAEEQRLVNELAAAQPNCLLNICIEDVSSRKGTKRSEEELLKFRAKTLGHVVSADTRAKISQAQIGRPKSEENKKRMSDAHKGKPLTEHHRASIIEARLRIARRPIIDGKIYESISAAARELGIGVGTVYSRASSFIEPD